MGPAGASWRGRYQPPRQDAANRADRPAPAAVEASGRHGVPACHHSPERATVDRIKQIEDERRELLRRREDLAVEIRRIAELDDPDAGEVERGERQLRASDKITDQLVALRSEQSEIIASAVSTGRATTEAGSWQRGTRGRGPELLQRVQPYDDLDAVRSKQLPDTEVIGRARAAVDAAPEHMNDTARQHVTELIEHGASKRDRAAISRHMLLTGSPEYHEAFELFCASRASLWSDAHREAMRMVAEEADIHRAAMSLADAAHGQALVPFTLDPTILLTNTSVRDPIRMLATIKQTATESWSGVTSAGITSEWTAEGSVWADASPNNFVQPTITPKKADAWVEGSYEVLADTNFAAQLGTLLADSKARLEAAAFAVANTGATIPQGIVAGVQAVTASIVTASSTTSLAIGDIYRVFNAVTPRGEENMSWVGNKAIFSLVRQFDTSGGSAFWSNLAGPGVPPSLLGAPAYSCSSMANAVGANNPVLLAGDVGQAYYIVDRIGMTVVPVPVVMDPTTGRPTGRAGYAAYWRVGAQVINVDAMRVLKMQTTATAVPLA